MHTHCIIPTIFKGKNKLKEASLSSSHCSALGIEVDGRGWFIPSMTNPSQPAARMLIEHNPGPSGVAQAATLLILKPLNSQTAISSAQNELSSVLTVRMKISLLGKSIPAHSFSGKKSHSTVCGTRLGCCGAAAHPDLALGTGSPWLYVDERSCAEQVVLWEELMGGKHKH